MRKTGSSIMEGASKMVRGMTQQLGSRKSSTTSCASNSSTESNIELEPTRPTDEYDYDPNYDPKRRMSSQALIDTNEQV